MVKCKLCREQSVDVPENIRKCPSCRKAIEKVIGCDHMKCPCGYEFCYYCSQKWTHSHICETKIPSRKGISFIFCLATKILLLIPLSIVVLLLCIFFTSLICVLSSTMIGFLLYFHALDSLKEANTSDSVKILAFTSLTLLLPVLFVIGLVPGFLIPLLNICYKRKVFFDTEVVPDIFERLFGCLNSIRLI